MKDFKITVTFSAENFNNAHVIEEYLRNDILPECVGVINPSIKVELNIREVGSYNEEDIQNCAIEYGFEPLTEVQIGKVFDLMEAKLATNHVINWYSMAFYISKVIKGEI